MVLRLFSKQHTGVRFSSPAFMKMFNKFKIWFGKKLIDWGFTILIRMNTYDWNPKTNRYPGSIKQLRYNFGCWLTTHGMKMETRALNKTGWPGYENMSFYIKKNVKKRKKNNNGFDGFNLNDFFPDWDGNS